jgi:hypothetical protein
MYVIHFVVNCLSPLAIYFQAKKAYRKLAAKPDSWIVTLSQNPTFLVTLSNLVSGPTLSAAFRFDRCYFEVPSGRRSISEGLCLLLILRAVSKCMWIETRQLRSTSSLGNVSEVGSRKCSHYRRGERRRSNAVTARIASTAETSQDKGLDETTLLNNAANNLRLRLKLQSQYEEHWGGRVWHLTTCQKHFE